MAKYKVTINTDAYKCRACSKKDWEPGTMNDYMIALNGWNTTENSLREVMWRLEMFHGNDFVNSEWTANPRTETGLSDRYTKWRNKRCNTVTYFDRLCGFKRRQRPSGYGFMQGYFSIEETIQKLKKDGTVKIPFSYLYDTRQYYKGMNGCYMEITKVKEKTE